MATALDIITGALRDIGILDAIEIPSDEDAAVGLTYLNDLLEAWSNEGLTVYTQSQNSLTLTGAASYTVGSGGTFNTTRPIFPESAIYRSQGVTSWMPTSYTGLSVLSYISGTSFSVVTASDQTSFLSVGTLIYLYDGTTNHYGTITTSTSSGGGLLQTITCSNMSPVLTNPFSGTPALYYQTTQYTDYPVQIINLEQYNSIPYKAATGGIPEVIAFNTAVPLSTMYVYPVVSTGTITLVSQKPLTAAALLTTVLAFPNGYERMIRLLLGVELMPGYGVQNQQIAAMAAKAKQDIKRINYRPATLDNTLNVGRRNRYGNILNGAY